MARAAALATIRRMEQQAPKPGAVETHRQLEGACSRTTAKSLSALRSFFRFLHRDGVVEGDPSENLETPRLPRSLPAVVPG